MLAERTIRGIDDFQRLILVLIVAVLPLVIDPGVLYAFVDSKFVMIQVLVFLLLLSQAFRLVLSRSSSPWPLLSIIILLLILVYFLHFPFDPVPSYSLLQAIKYTALLMVPMFMIARVNNFQQLHKMQDTLILLSLPLLAYSLSQYLIHDPLRYVRSTTDPRVHGTLGNSHYLGGYLAMLLFVFIDRARQGRGKFMSTVAVFGIPLVLISLLVADSRGAVLCLLVTSYLYAGYRILSHIRRRPVYKAALALWIMVALAAFSYPYWSRYLTPESPIRRQEIAWLTDPSINARIILSLVSLHLWMKNPFWGVGVDRFPIDYFWGLHELATAPQNFAIRKQTVLIESLQAKETHNDLLQYLAELGLIGYGLLVGILIVSCYALLRILLSRRLAVVRRDRILSGCLLLGIISGFVQLIYSFPLHLPANAMLFFFLIGSAGFLMKRHRILLLSPPSFFSSFYFRWTLAIFLAGYSVFGMYSVMRKYVGLVLANQGVRLEVHERRPLVALKFYERAGELFPENGEIKFYKARVYSQSRTTMRKALRLLDEAEKTYFYAPVAILRSLILVELQRFGEAREAIEALAEVNQRMNDVNMAYGMVLYHQGDFVKAIDAFKKELFHNPGSKRALLHLGQSYFQTGQYELAERVFTEAVERGIKSVELRERLGDIYAREDFRPREAVEHYRQALAWAQEADRPRRVRLRIRNKIEAVQEKIDLLDKSSVSLSTGGTENE